MYDLETLGKRPGCSILSIGAVPFDPQIGFVGGADGEADGFYATIGRKDCRIHGLVEEPETLKWWHAPERAEAWESVHLNCEELGQALSAFCDYIVQVKPDNIWAWGSDFDFPILRFALDRLEIDEPFNHRAVSCARSVCKPWQLRPEHVRGEGEVHHHALFDAIVQARVVCAAYEKMGLKRAGARPVVPARRVG